MANTYRGEFQDNKGNTVYPHTESEIVFCPDGETVQEKLLKTEGVLGESNGTTGSLEINDSKKLVTSDATYQLAQNQGGCKLSYENGEFYVQAGADTASKKKLGNSLDNAEFYDVVTSGRIDGNATLNGTISTNATSLDIILVTTIYRASLVTGGTLSISGYNTLEQIVKQEPTGSNYTTLYHIYHVEKEADAKLTIHVTNTRSDYAMCFTRAIVLR